MKINDYQHDKCKDKVILFMNALSTSYVHFNDVMNQGSNAIKGRQINEISRNTVPELHR